MDKKKVIMKYGVILSSLYRLFGRNKYSIPNGNEVTYSGVFMKNCSICIRGVGNKIIIEPGLTRLYDTHIAIFASNAKIYIGTDCNFHGVSLYIEDGGEINIGKHVTISGNTNIAVIEKRSVAIGNDCLFSANIQIRVGDSHSILDSQTGKRINPSKDVLIGNHVWVGNSVNILKGSIIADNSIIGTSSVVTGKSFPTNCIIGGIPAKVLKEGVTWDSNRLPIE